MPNLDFALACPACGAPLAAACDVASCPDCDERYRQADGVWDFLPVRRAAAFAPFLAAYQVVRSAEGWGSAEAGYYGALPSVPPGDPRRAIWQARAATLRAFEARILAPREASHGRSLEILDLGAGNGWLAHRLSLRGHHVAAVDLSTSRTDGLGARVHYPNACFVAIRAEFDRLPFADAQADLVVFNAALHHAADYEITLREALRVLRPDGQIVVLDTPVYHDRSSGEAMLAERDRRHQVEYHLAPGLGHQEGFLTWDRLDRLGEAFQLQRRVVWPLSLAHRFARRTKARLVAPREPAEFPIVVLRRQEVGTVGASEMIRPSSNKLCLERQEQGRDTKVPDGGVSRDFSPASLLLAFKPERAPSLLLPFKAERVSPVSSLLATKSRALSMPIRPQLTEALARAALHRAGRFAVRLRYRLFQRHRHRRLAIEQVGPWSILVLPDVFNPKLFRTGELLARALDATLVRPDSAVLDLGTGSGIGAIAAAGLGGRVVAVDVNPEAIRCARINVILNGVEGSVELRPGDLFGPVGDQRFDLVLFNPPFFRGAPRDLFDHSWRSNDIVERFAAGLANHLTPDGKALVVLSSDGAGDDFLAVFRANCLSVEVVLRRGYLNETLTIYCLRAKGG